MSRVNARGGRGDPASRADSNKSYMTIVSPVGNYGKQGGNRMETPETLDGDNQVIVQPHCQQSAHPPTSMVQTTAGGSLQ